MLMAPPSERHQEIVLNLARKLSDLGRDRGCRAVPGIAVVSDAMDNFAPIPDIVCDVDRAGATATPAIPSSWPRCSRPRP